MERALASEQSTASCSRVTPSSQPYPRLRKGSVPRPRAGAVARRVHTGPSRVPPCHVTNTGEEMLDHELYPDPDIIEKSQYQIPNPELGPLERQIELRYEEALFEDDPSYNPEHTSYWFTEPPGGWNQEPKRIRKATIVPNVDATAHNPGEGRIKFVELEEGQELTGTINRLLLIHGVQVDIGAEFDALIPMPEAVWSNPEFREAMKLDAELDIRIHKIVPSYICRFPIIAELLFPRVPAKQQEQLQKHLAAYEPVFNLCGQSDIETAKLLTGREYKPYSYFLDVTPDAGTRKLMAMQEAQEDEGKDPQDAVSPALLAKIRDMAAAM